MIFSDFVLPLLPAIPMLPFKPVKEPLGYSDLHMEEHKASPQGARTGYVGHEASSSHPSFTTYSFLHKHY